MFGRELLEPNSEREQFERSLLTRDVVELNAVSRCIVHNTIFEVCNHRGWIVHALHVRTNHVHLVVTAQSHRPERVMNDCKSWSTRRMVEAGALAAGLKSWARHGSTVYLWRTEHVLEKVDYVVNQQGAVLEDGPPPYKRDGLW
jgi:REP element-mobilizing transposase RayT